MHSKPTDDGIPVVEVRSLLESVNAELPDRNQMREANDFEKVQVRIRKDKKQITKKKKVGGKKRRTKGE